jgi:signal peptidase I
VTSSWTTYAPDPQQAPQDAPPKGRSRAVGCLIELVETVVLTVILFVVIQNFVAQPFQVRQHSMETTIEDSQYVLVDRLTPRFDPYHRGDIIVFTPPESNAESPAREPFIKRVIGVGGDTVELKGGKVYVNGTLLVEPYVYREAGVAQPTLPSGDTKWTVPAGDLFVMGDHRAMSTDSRVFGPIEVSTVIGRAWLRYWPIADLEILPTSSHPELSATASPRPSANSSAKPSAKPAKTAKPTKTPKP